jgi:hypothetical protein
MTETELFFFNQLNEKQQRLYAGLKSSNIGYHGVSQVSKELESQISLPDNGVRKDGGGRKKKSKPTLK